MHIAIHTLLPLHCPPTLYTSCVQGNTMATVYILKNCAAHSSPIATHCTHIGTSVNLTCYFYFTIQYPRKNKLCATYRLPAHHLSSLQRVDVLGVCSRNNQDSLLCTVEPLYFQHNIKWTLDFLCMYKLVGGSKSVGNRGVTLFTINFTSQ